MTRVQGIRAGRFLPGMAILIGALSLISTPAAASGIVAPGHLTNTEGNENNSAPFDWAWPLRTQQVYAASEFSSWGGPEYIQAIAFRLDGPSMPFGATINDVTIRLSTTSRGPDGLSAVFADNIGANESVVYQGALPIFSTDEPHGGGQPHAFDIVINLQKPFLFDPSQGNLLLDITNPGKAGNIYVNGTKSIILDTQAVSGDTVSRVLGYVASGQPGNPYATTDLTYGNPDTYGLVTQFRTGGPDPLPQPGIPAVVPEPTVTAVLLCGLPLLVMLQRRRHRP